MTRRRFRSLASRLVALGVVQLVLLAGTAIGIFFAQGPRGEAHPDERVDPATIRELERVSDQPAALAAALEELREDRIEVSLYDANKQLVASNIEPALSIPPRRPRAPPPGMGGMPGPPPDNEGPPPPLPLGGFGTRPRVLVRGIMLNGQRGYLIARGVAGRPSWWLGPILTLVCGMAILVIGALITARWIVRPVDRLARTAHAFGSGDLHARSRLERSDEIGQLGHRFDEMADRIEGLMVSEKELLANVAHELRTPLTRIGVALDLAGEGDAEAARASLAEIAVDVSELEVIIDDILTAMRFEIAEGKGPSAQLPLRRTRVPPVSLADAAAERMRSRHGSRPLKLEIASDLPEVDVDPVLFRRVLDNLLENAHKYTPEAAAPITLAVRRAAARVVFEVRDPGIGIAAEDLPNIFTAFFRSERSRSRETGGVGLGLTLAKRIVEAHDGTIEVESRRGIGTTIRVAILSGT
jgi:two-component system OmpR family sensor kinase